ncbi:MAG: peptidoglycan/LPS O-acetylase OafA/YrhL [Verrucomicrobiales bacterium]
MDVVGFAASFSGSLTERDKTIFLHINGIDHGEFTEMTVTNDPHYRPEIDGLRSVAMLALLIFLLDRAWLPGGFAGVDVFFVISGYLITSIIVRGCDSGTFSLAQFYQRRIERLFPALLVMLVVSLLVARFLFTSWDFANISASFSSALLSIANIDPWNQGDYFAMPPDAQPLLHCWSLSVEEQFYLVFPLVLLGLMR